MLKYFTEKNVENWKKEGFQSKDAYLSLLQSLEANTLPIKGEFYEISDPVIKYTKDPLAKTQGYYLSLKSGTPKFKIVDGHEMDSEWYYPEISRAPVNVPLNDISHADYVTAHPTLHKIV